MKNNVENLLILCEKKIRDSVNPCLTLPNNENTWKIITEKICEILSTYPEIQDYMVLCNEHTNTKMGIENGIIEFALMISCDKKKYLMQTYKLEMEKQKIKDVCRKIEGGIFKNGGKKHECRERKQD